MNQNILKRNGLYQQFDFEKVKKSIYKEFSKIKNVYNISEKRWNDLPNILISKLKLNNVKSTNDIIDFICKKSISLNTLEYPFNVLASRFYVSNLHKIVKNNFFDFITQIFETYPNTFDVDKYYPFIQDNKDLINKAINFENDYDFNFLSLKTFEDIYLLKINDILVETPQYIFMRYCIAINVGDIYKVLESYYYISNKYFTHASPTIYNSMKKDKSLSSCFLINMYEDSINGIFETIKDCAKISQSGAGIGLSIQNIRSRNSNISEGIQKSQGVIPMLKVIDSSIKYVNEGNRNGSICVYIEPWHSDILEFIHLKKNTGDDSIRCRNLFYALWIPDLFMKRVELNQDFSLFSPDKCPNLDNTYGEEFENLYLKYENEGLATSKINARILMDEIITMQCESGGPFILYKDSCNKKSNQKNLGTIKSSNLCTEIIQYSSKNEIAVCNLASICIKKFLKEDNSFDFELLYKISKIITENLNKVIDNTFYPIKKSKDSNLKHRPIGIGIQGLADLFMLMNIPFCSDEAKKLNILISETIYYASLESSCELSREFGPYSSYKDSPSSNNILQYDFWNKNPTSLWDWEKLKINIKKYGLYNSLLTTQMPTVGTSQLMCNYESIEPIISNIYTKRTKCGEYQCLNLYLYTELNKLNLWNVDIKNKIIMNDGSIQNIESIPENIKNVYKTVWEMSQKELINMYADRAPFIDQSQSLNLYIKDVNYNKIRSAHFHTWRLGLKTGMYYLRTLSPYVAKQITIDNNYKNNESENNDNDNNYCISCSG